MWHIYIIQHLKTSETLMHAKTQMNFEHSERRTHERRKEGSHRRPHTHYIPLIGNTQGEKYIKIYVMSLLFSLV